MDKLIGVGSLLFLLICHVVQGKQCMYPGHGLHMRTNMTTSTVIYNTMVSYKCDAGFEIFGPITRKCQIDGKWTGKEPVCAVNVARHGKVVAASTNVDTREGPDEWSNIIDAYIKTCSVASNTDMMSSSWTIDLLFEYGVKFIKVVFGEPIKGVINIYEGNSTGSKILLPIDEDSFRNAHSVSVDLEYGDAKEMSEYLLKFERSVTTRFITLQIPTQYQIQSRITLCEVSVYSVTAASPEQCHEQWIREAEISVLGSSCYSFHHNHHKLRWKDAKSRCKHINNGNLISHVNEASQEFLRLTLKRSYSPVTMNDIFWVGGHKRSEFEADGITPLHKWKNETTEKYFASNTHDSSGLGDALDSCLAISGPLGWKWTTKNCYSHYPWICEYPLPHCGYPDQEEWSIMTLSLGPAGTRIAQYSCPEGFAVIGDTTRTCLSTGHWSGTAPKCQFVDCGHPVAIINGSVKLVQGTTTYGSVAEYSCVVAGLYLIGPKTRVCQRDEQWSEDTPFCSDVLPDPEGQTAILNLEIVLAVALVSLGMVIMITIITLCVVFFKKRPRKTPSFNEVETKNFLTRFDSDSDIGVEPIKNGAPLAGYETIKNGAPLAGYKAINGKA